MIELQIEIVEELKIDSSTHLVLLRNCKYVLIAHKKSILHILSTKEPYTLQRIIADEKTIKGFSNKNNT